MSTPGTTFWGPDFVALADEDPESRTSFSASWTGCAADFNRSPARTSRRRLCWRHSGSTLSNKYAEGYPGRRYYGSCQQVDRAEEIGIARAKQLFGADTDVHVNLQPPTVASGIHVGTPAVTAQGMGEADMAQVAWLVARAIRDDQTRCSEPASRSGTGLAGEVKALVSRRPAYPRSA